MAEHDQTPQGQWMSAARFEQLHGGSGVDRDYGMRWGPRGDQRVSLRLALGAEQGLLYAYDPLWDECQVLAGPVAVATVDAAFDEVLTREGPHGMPVEVLATAVERAATVRPWPVTDVDAPLDVILTRKAETTGLELS